MNSVRVTGVARGAACLLACALASHSAMAGPGDLDASFGANGFARPTLPATTVVSDAALQTDGKIVIVGAVNASADGSGNRNAIVIRLNENGSLDASFSGDGIATVDFGGNDTSSDVLITADDKILIAGKRFGGLPTGSVPVLARLNADGSLDATFGQGGVALCSTFFDVDVGSLVELSDGRLVAGGSRYNSSNTDFAMFAVNANGAPDTTFGTNGRQVVDFAGANESIVEMRRLPGDRVIAVGESNNNGVQSIGLMLVNSAGQLDTSFGPAAGVLRIGDWNSVQDIELQADGKLLIAGGQLGYGFPVMGMVVRLNPDGTIDRSFGSEGRILRSDEVKQVAADASGRIYFAGEITARPQPAPYDGGRRGYVEAVERDGATARTFAASGGTTIDVGRDSNGSNLTVLALLRHTDGRLVVVGTSVVDALVIVGVASGGEHGGVLSVSRPIDGSSAVSEAATGGVSFRIERTGGSDGTVSVSYAAESSVAVAGQDFVATSGTLTWGDGETATKTITLPLIDDNDFEPEYPNEPIALRIFDPTGGASLATSTASVLVSSDEKMTQVDLFSDRVGESAGTLNLLAKRTGDARVRAVVQYSVSSDSGQAQPNVDFTPVSGTLTWEPFDMSAKIIAIPVLDDAVMENSEEQVRVQLSAASPGVTAYASATGTIVDDDGSSGTWYRSVSVVSEGVGSVTATFGHYGDSNVPVTANVSVQDPAGSNLPGPDHGAPNVAQVSWAANDTTPRTVTIPIVDDAVAEGPEQFTLLIEVPGYGTYGVHLFTILDNDSDVSTPSQLGFSQAELNVTENVGTASVTVNRSGALAFPIGATVTVTGSDLIPPLNFPVFWAGGDSAPKTIVIPIVNDTIREPRKSLAVGLKDVFGGARVGPIVSTRINVADDDGFTNTIGFPQSEIVISEDADYVDLPIVTAEPRDSYGPEVSFVIRNGGTADAGREFVLPRTPQSFFLTQYGDSSFRVYLNGDNQFEDEETFTVDLVTGAESMPIGQGSVTVRLTSDDSSNPGAPMQIGFVTTAISQREDQSVVNVTVRRMGAADSAVAVSYETAAGSAAAGSDFVAATGQLQWAAGDMADKTIALMLTNDSAVESTETMTLRLFAPTNGATLAEATATISITDDDSAAPPPNNGGSGGSGGGGGGGGSLGLSMLFTLLLLGTLRIRKTMLTKLALLIATALAANTALAAEEEWHALFNGKDLSGWTIKIAKRPLNENYADTFRVEDGMIKVSYDRYPKFDSRFGHLYTNQPYSSYILRLEYRMVGQAAADAPHWAKLNSGVMIHAQSPLSLRLEQGFPVSMEFQFLASGATAGKQTGNAVTPGTNLEIDGKLLTDHIIESKSRLFPLDEWVTAEIEVHGYEEVIHRINGVEVLRYRHPQLDPTDADAQRLLAAGAPLQLAFGHIALQAESQPIWFRNIRIRPLN